MSKIFITSPETFEFVQNTTLANLLSQESKAEHTLRIYCDSGTERRRIDPSSKGPNVQTIEQYQVYIEPLYQEDFYKDPAKSENNTLKSQMDSCLGFLILPFHNQERPILCAKTKNLFERWKSNPEDLRKTILQHNTKPKITSTIPPEKQLENCENFFRKQENINKNMSHNRYHVADEYISRLISPISCYEKSFIKDCEKQRILDSQKIIEEHINAIKVEVQNYQKERREDLEKIFQNPLCTPYEPFEINTRSISIHYSCNTRLADIQYSGQHTETLHLFQINPITITLDDKSETYHPLLWFYTKGECQVLILKNPQQKPHPYAMEYTWKNQHDQKEYYYVNTYPIQEPLTDLVARRLTNKIPQLIQRYLTHIQDDTANRTHRMRESCKQQ